MSHGHVGMTPELGPSELWAGLSYDSPGSRLPELRQDPAWWLGVVLCSWGPLPAAPTVTPELSRIGRHDTLLQMVPRIPVDWVGGEWQPCLEELCEPGINFVPLRTLQTNAQQNRSPYSLSCRGGHNPKSKALHHCPHCGATSVLANMLACLPYLVAGPTLADATGMLLAGAQGLPKW